MERGVIAVLRRVWRRLGPAVPLPVWAAAGTGGSCLLVLAAVATHLALRGRLDAVAAEAITVAAVLAAGAAALAWLAGARLAGALVRLRAEALDRLQDPAAPLPGAAEQRPSLSASTELAE